jgi:MFS family permease
MFPVSTHDPRQTSRGPRNNRLGGVALIAIGAWLLLAQLTSSDLLGLLFLPLVGLGFIGWALQSHHFGLLVPGGILLGIGVGSGLINALFPDAAGNIQGGVFFLAFAAGWLLIALLSGLADNHPHRWPLIPGGIMAVLGSLLIIGSAAAPILAFLADWWPLAMIAIGVALYLKKTP